MQNVHASQRTYPNAAPHAGNEVHLSRHAHEAYGLLHMAFVIAPVVGALALARLSLEDDKKALAARGLRREP